MLRPCASCANTACSTASSSCTFTSGARSRRFARSRTPSAKPVASSSSYRRPGPLRYVDVGGGLGVDYDGSQTNFSSSMNYSLQEYANDVVYGMMELCDEAQIPHPVIVSESGRAISAHHAVLIVDVLGVAEFDVGKMPDTLPDGVAPVVPACGSVPRRLAQEPAGGVSRLHRVQRRVSDAVHARSPVAK